MHLPNLSVLDIATKRASVDGETSKWVLDEMFESISTFIAESNDAKAICTWVHTTLALHRHDPNRTKQIYRRGCELLRVNLGALESNPDYRAVFEKACQIASMQRIRRDTLFLELGQKNNPFHGTLFYVYLNEINAIDYVSPRVDFLRYPHNDMYYRELVLAAVMKDGMRLKHASLALRGDRKVVLAVVKKSGMALEYASPELKADRNVVLAAVTQHGYALRYASADLKADREVVLAAVSNFAMALVWASDELQADREVVLAAVTQDGWVLQYASDALKADYEVVLAAVRQDGQALEWASNELRDDRDVVLTAVTQNGWALEWASNELRDDRDVVLAAEPFIAALQYASERLRNMLVYS